MSRDLKTTLLKVGESIFRSSRTIELIPTRMFIHPEGSTENKPSITLELAAGDREPVVYTQLTLKMIFDSMNAESLDLVNKEWQRLYDNWQFGLNGEKR